MIMGQTHSKSEAHKQKLREAAKRRYADPQERQKQSERLKQVYQENQSLHRMHSAESHEKRGRTLTDKWQTQEYRDSILASRNTPEVKDKLRAAAETQWAQHRDSLVAAIRASRYQHLNEEQFNDPDWLRQTNDHHTLTEMAQLVGCSQSCMSRQFARFGIIPKQHPLAYTGGESQILEFLESLQVSYVHRDRSVIPPYEIDVYVPDYRLGIEYHGCFWHSYNHLETTVERQRHQRKHAAAAAANIRLLQFWDVEWAQHPAICQNIIQGVLRQNQTRGARECELRTPTPTEVTIFLTAHHLQGPRPYTYARGLYWQNELVMVMTIGKSRFKRGTWEIIRLAAASGLHIAGGAVRLWSALRALLPPGCVVYSYADKRVFQGTIYPALGFTWSHDTPPGYHYWRDGQLYSRLAFQKHKLAALPGYDAVLTESENMFQQGYRRLWDAGQSVWVYQHP